MGNQHWDLAFGLFRSGSLFWDPSLGNLGTTGLSHQSRDPWGIIADVLICCVDFWMTLVGELESSWQAELKIIESLGALVTYPLPLLRLLDQETED